METDRTYLRHQEGSVGLSRSLLQATAPPCAHGAVSQAGSTSTSSAAPLYNPHHPSSAPVAETSPRTDTPAHSCCVFVCGAQGNVPGINQDLGITGKRTGTLSRGIQTDVRIMKAHRSAFPVLTCIGALCFTHAHSVRHSWPLRRVHIRRVKP
ncbi:hypothetical protein D4764_03G0001680 [Takifugu flavidus]|uniref:Uncharacterized protein n=1 Tax=Takifugu flavidus TaxID=433684 RepID=A0A5C6NBB1_9TELE|nr:hypothetical protein D4764_03G0001680 [Takifugu flavidus]